MTHAATLDHIALIVRDPARTTALLENVFAAKAIRRRDSDGHDETYLRVGGIWFVLVTADVDRPLAGDHVAFRTSVEQMKVMAGKLKQMGHAYQMARSDTALYFTDFDNHMFEINSTGVDADLADAT